MHEHPSVLVQLHWCPSILREEALCSRLRCLPRALQLPKLDCAKHNWLVRSSLNVKSEGMPCRCTHIHICVFIINIYIYTYLYMHIKLYVPDMFKHVFISHLYMFWAALYVYSFEGHELRNQLSRIVVRLLFDQREGKVNTPPSTAASLASIDGCVRSFCWLWGPKLESNLRL